MSFPRLVSSMEAIILCKVAPHPTRQLVPFRVTSFWEKSLIQSRVRELIQRERKALGLERFKSEPSCREGKRVMSCFMLTSLITFFSDWLWPAVWMLPENNTYGAWPASGEIDIIEARGNGPTYPAQGSNFVRSSLNYGPLPTVFNQIFGWLVFYSFYSFFTQIISFRFSQKRSSFDQSFHTYTLEWDSKFMRFYTDSRLHAMLETQVQGQSLVAKKKSFWDKAGFPLTALNGSSGAEVIVTNPWEGSSYMAPFDQCGLSFCHSIY